MLEIPRKPSLLAITVILAMPMCISAYTVKVAWDRNAEADVVGYNLYRSTTPGSGYVKVNTTLILQPPLSTVPSYTDQTPENVKYYYVVRAVNQTLQESSNSNEAAAIPPASSGAPKRFSFRIIGSLSLLGFLFLLWALLGRRGQRA